MSSRSRPAGAISSTRAGGDPHQHQRTRQDHRRDHERGHRVRALHVPDQDEDAGRDREQRAEQVGEHLVTAPRRLSEPVSERRRMDQRDGVRDQSDGRERHHRTGVDRLRVGETQMPA